MTARRISQAEVEPLPRWARLGLALRCVRRARGLVQLPEAQARLLDNVLDRVAHAVHHAAAGDDLADAAASAYTLALDNVDAPTPAPADDDTFVSACMVAHSAAFAAEAATLANRHQAAHIVAQSIDFAIHAHQLSARANAPAAVAAMRADLERVRLRGAAAGLSDDSPLPVDFFDGP